MVDVKSSTFVQRSRSLKSSNNWGLYRAFFALALLQDLGPAAGSMGISVATMKRRLDRLEALHSTKLYYRSGGDVRLTQYGEFILSKLRKADVLLASTFSKKEKNSHLESKKIKIGVDPGLYRLVIVPFLTAYPEYANQFSIDAGLLAYKVEKIKDNADITLSIMENSDVNYDVYSVSDLGFCFIATQEYIKNRGMPSYQTFSEHTFILPSRVVYFEDDWLSLLRLQRESRNCLSVANVADGVLLIRADLGFGLASVRYLQPLDVVLEDLPPITVKATLSVRKELMEDPQQARLVTDLLAFARQTTGGAV